MRSLDQVEEHSPRHGLLLRAELLTRRGLPPQAQQLGSAVVHAATHDHFHAMIHVQKEVPRALVVLYGASDVVSDNVVPHLLDVVLFHAENQWMLSSQPFDAVNIRVVLIHLLPASVLWLCGGRALPQSLILR